LDLGFLKATSIQPCIHSMKVLVVATRLCDSVFAQARHTYHFFAFFRGGDTFVPMPVGHMSQGDQILAVGYGLTQEHCSHPVILPTVC